VVTRVEYGEAAAAGYGRHRGSAEAVLDELVRGAAVTASSRVLEVGCGTGNYAIALRSRTGAACAGIDPSAEMLAVARRRARHLRFRHGRGEALPFPGGHFDVVFTVDVVHHLADVRAYFAEAQRVLRRGGRLCTVTEDESMIRSRRLAEYFPEIVAVELARYPAVERLKSALAATGFVAVADQHLEWALAVESADDCRAKVYSSLRMLSDEAFDRGLERLERDLLAGPLTVRGRALVLWATRP
jgi:SAM-dependent methyltransferase